MADKGGHADKDNYVDGGNVPGREKDGREGFGDDGGSRVGKPDEGKNAGPSTSTAGDMAGEEGSILDDENTRRGMDTKQSAPGSAQSRVQQQSQSTQSGPLGGGGEAAAGMHAAGQADSSSEREGSEPLDRSREHKGSYGGEGGAARTSSDQREPINPS